MVKRTTIIGVSLVAALTTAALVPMAYAEPPQGAAGTSADAPGGTGTPPEKPSGEAGGAPGGGANSSSVEHSGVLTISEDMSTDSENYNSTGDAENAILMTGGVVNLTNPTIEKTGSDDGDSSDFYGTNAAVFVSGGTLNISGGSVNTNGAHANALFAYGEGILNVSNATIKTTSNNSGAVMVTGGGTLTATYVTATTEGNSSAPIRSDRGGGTMTIEGGTYTSHGVGSPAIYSTADVNVKGATLESTASEGVVIEGKNSVSLENVTLTADNTQLNGNSETYKTIFIYQSMSGDADEGVGEFTAKNSTITTKNGDTFFVTNTTADISLENNTFTNTSGDFLRIQAGGWGNSGSNGGAVTLTATAQEMRGGIIVDNISSLSLALYDDSYFKGTINGENTAELLSIHLSEDSVLVLEGDSYLSMLDNDDAENKNIYGNGHKLYVDGKEVTTNSATPPEGRKNATTTTNDAAAIAKETETVDDYSTLGFILASVGCLLVLIVGGILIARCCKKPAAGNDPAKNDGLATDGNPGTSDSPETHGDLGTDGGQVKGPDGQ